MPEQILGPFMSAVMACIYIIFSWIEIWKCSPGPMLSEKWIDVRAAGQAQAT